MSRNLPRFTPAANRLFNRARFLDGTYKTYIAPRQRPGALASYSPPTDWRPAKSLLIVPRVVWLNIYNDLASLGDPFYETFSLEYWQFSNADYQEHIRLLGVFAQVKSQIEAIQPGKTWVEIVDWGAWCDQMGTDVPTFTDNIAGVSDYLPSSDGFLQFPTPPASVQADSFFGVDFLNIWTGDAAVGYAKWQGTGDGLPYFNPGGSGTTGYPDSDGNTYAAVGNPYYDGPSARVRNFYGSFRRYGSWLYSADQPWTSPVSCPPHDHALPFFEDYSQIQPLIQGLAAGFFGDAASDLSGCGVVYKGGTSQITTDYLMQAIAQHFGFDPSSGADSVSL